MRRDGPLQAMLVVFGVALVCSLIVSTSAILLRPLQERNELIRRSRNIVALTGLTAPGGRATDEEVLAIAGQLDARVIDVDTGAFVDQVEAAEFDARAAARDPERSAAIPPALDIASLGRRARRQVVYLVWQDGSLHRVILPIHGQGMWSTLYGYIALEDDLETIADVTFYEQAETAGLGDQIERRDWQRQWQGQRLHDPAGIFRFRVAQGEADDESPYEVDGLTGATITGDAVTALVDYWFGQHGYAPFLQRLREAPPAPPASMAFMENAM